MPRGLRARPLSEREGGVHGRDDEADGIAIMASADYLPAHCYCDQRVVLVSQRSDARGAREEARRFGWVRRAGRDLCPDCVAGQ